MSEPVISVRDCCFAYEADGFRLRAVSLDVLPGEVLGIVGPNGSGKSTLLRLMAGLLRADSGRLLLRERPVADIPRRRLAQELAFLPQSPESCFGFLAREVVAMGRYPHQRGFGFLTSDDVAAVERALGDTDSSALADRRFDSLSGGEKQRVLIGSVLAQQPAVMLLDEPTTALDIHHQADVLDLLWRSSRKGIGVAAVTHDLNAAARFCDRLVLMAHGSVAREGAPADVLEQDLLSRVYGADVRVVANPVTDTPLVVVPGKAAHHGA